CRRATAGPGSQHVSPASRLYYDQYVEQDGGYPATLMFVIEGCLAFINPELAFPSLALCEDRLFFAEIECVITGPFTQVDRPLCAGYGRTQIPALCLELCFAPPVPRAIATCRGHI